MILLYIRYVLCTIQYIVVVFNRSLGTHIIHIHVCVCVSQAVDNGNDKQIQINQCPPARTQISSNDVDVAATESVRANSPPPPSPHDTDKRGASLRARIVSPMSGVCASMGRASPETDCKIDIYICIWFSYIMCLFG